MAQGFQIQSLDYERFARYFGMTDDELVAADAVRRIVAAGSAAPCRVSLRDAEVGDEVVLFSFAHLDACTPYRASGPIFVRKDAVRADLPADELPAMLGSRIISLRAYNSARFIVDAAVTPGAEAKSVIETLMENPEVEFIHIHFAKHGCFACSVVRA